MLPAATDLFKGVPLVRAGWYLEKIGEKLAKDAAARPPNDQPAKSIPKLICAVDEVAKLNWTKTTPPPDRAGPPVGLGRYFLRILRMWSLVPAINQRVKLIGIGTGVCVDDDPPGSDSIGSSHKVLGTSIHIKFSDFHDIMWSTARHQPPGELSLEVRRRLYPNSVGTYTDAPPTVADSEVRGDSSSSNSEQETVPRITVNFIRMVAVLCWPRVRLGVACIRNRVDTDWLSWPSSAGADCTALCDNIFRESVGIPASFRLLPYTGTPSRGRLVPDLLFAHAFLTGIKVHCTTKERWNSRQTMTTLTELLPKSPTLFVNAPRYPSLFEKFGVLLLSVLAVVHLSVTAIPNGFMPLAFHNMLEEARKAGVREVRFMSCPDERAFPFTWSSSESSAPSSINYTVLARSFVDGLVTAMEDNVMLVVTTAGVDDHRLDYYAFAPRGRTDAEISVTMLGCDMKSTSLLGPTHNAISKAKSQNIAGLGHVLRWWGENGRVSLKTKKRVVINKVIASVMLAEGRKKEPLSIECVNRGAVEKERKKLAAIKNVFVECTKEPLSRECVNTGADEKEKTKPVVIAKVIPSVALVTESSQQETVCTEDIDRGTVEEKKPLGKKESDESKSYAAVLQCYNLSCESPATAIPLVVFDSGSTNFPPFSTMLSSKFPEEQ